MLFLSMAIGKVAFAGPSAGTTATTLVLPISEKIDAAVSAAVTVNLSMPDVAQGASSYAITPTTGSPEFTISGEPGATLTLGVPSTIQLLGTKNSANVMNIGSVALVTASAPSTPTTTVTLDGTTGTASMYLIGTRESITSTYANDTYTGTVTVTISYQ